MLYFRVVIGQHFRSISSFFSRNSRKSFIIATETSLTGPEDLQDRERKKRVVFLGTPSVAAMCLELLYNASSTRDFNIAAVVTQPPAPAGRNKKLTNSPVHEISLKYNIPIFTPEKIKDEQFLAIFEELDVDLCITAAYGMI